jgi:hypothetical protein
VRIIVGLNEGRGAITLQRYKRGCRWSQRNDMLLDMLLDMTVVSDNLAVIDASCEPEPKAQGTPLCIEP